jgi:hypothetical protein
VPLRKRRRWDPPPVPPILIFLDAWKGLIRRVITLLMERMICGTHCLNRKSKEETEIQGQKIQSLSLMRTIQRLLSKVRYVPYLLPASGFEGGDPRGDQVKLVKRKLAREGRKNGDD